MYNLLFVIGIVFYCQISRNHVPKILIKRIRTDQCTQLVFFCDCILDVKDTEPVGATSHSGSR